MAKAQKVVLSPEEKAEAKQPKKMGTNKER